jgi:tripeptide aminopeptidase
MDYKVDSKYLLDSFIKYVKIDTSSKEGVKTVPSSKGQIELGKLLLKDFRGLGLKDVKQDKNGYVIARIKGNTQAPAIAFIAHLDTSPECSAANLKPIVYDNYNGEDIVLPKDDVVIKVSDFPELKEKKGKTVITADGSTLLGGDDKSGIAVCMELAKFLLTEKDFQHGDVLFVFTPDEEIAHGSDLLNVEELKAVCGYTLDSEGLGSYCEETFCAHLMNISFIGKNIHPGQAKGKMVNAIRAASKFVEKMPFDESPETTEERQGFVHPTKMEGDVSKVNLTCIVRDFTMEGLEDRSKRMKKLAETAAEEFGALADVKIKEQYRNMKYKLDDDPRVVNYIKEAMEMSGIKPILKVARGGTDGSRLSYRGLLSPDISVGYYGIHSRLEWVCLEDMMQTSIIVRNLVKRWAKS